MSRDDILIRIRRNKPDSVPLPERFDQGIRYEHVLDAFLESLERVHVTAVRHSTEQAFLSAFTELYPDAQHVYSQYDVLCTFLDDDPHAYDCLDVAVYRGRLGVAENGAVFVDFGSEAQRSQAVLAQHLCLVINERDLVDNMHDAYQRLEHDFPDYGVFISGPSKTADIEQCLVVGAHGACTLVVAIISADPGS